MKYPNLANNIIANIAPINTMASYFAALSAVLEHINLSDVERVFQIMRHARDEHSAIFVAGNGGSAATASHWVNDLGKATKRSRRNPFRVMCLSDNTSWLTALSNDEGYERAFAGQLENFAQRGDVLIVLSASGNSPNLIKAVELAKSRDMVTIALLGFDGGKLKTIADEIVWAETEMGAYELAEDAHSVVCHAVTKCLIADRLEIS